MQEPSRPVCARSTLSPRFHARRNRLHERNPAQMSFRGGRRLHERAPARAATRSFPIRRSGRRRAPPAILRAAPCAPLARDALKRRFQARWTPFPVRPPVAGSLGSRSSVAVRRRRLATRLRRKRQGRRRRSTSRHGEQRCGDERPRTRVVPAPLSSRHRRARRRAPRRTLGRRAPPMSRIDADS